MNKVNFFIVGAMRSGTSSIRDQLDMDPSINMAHGEPMFFSNDSKYKEGIKAYHSLFDWSDANVVLRGEKSPRYAVSNDAPERVFKYNPEAKIIWMLRNPVKRAVSHFIHSKYRTEAALSLEYALDNAYSLEASNSTMAYVYRSQYDKQLNAWGKYFPNQKVIILEELVSNPTPVMQEIYNFLEVSPAIDLGFLKHSREKVDRAKSIIQDQNPVSKATLRKLHEALEPTINNVEEYLGRELPFWHTV